MSAESLTARRCSNCHAPLARLDAENCEYCGTALSRPPGEPVRSPHLDGVAARFAALDAHPDLPRLLQATPATPAHMGGVVKLILSIAFGLFVLSFLLPFVKSSPFGLVVLAVFAFAIVRGIAGAARDSRVAHAPLERRKALVVGERTRIHGDREREVESRHYATLELADGSRREHPVLEEIAGAVATGDIGVAYLRADHLVDFTRVRV